MDTELRALSDELLALRASALQLEQEHRRELEQVHPDQRKSAANLLHYLALRRIDLRPLQLRLLRLGLSSLGRCEAHVLASLDALLLLLGRLTGHTPVLPDPPSGVLTIEEGRELLQHNARALLGDVAPQRGVRIMVTMSSAAATDPERIFRKVEAGMECMRINCAHDDVAAWSRMLARLRDAERRLGRSCCVLMDLAGPKLRTGPMPPGPSVRKWRPQRDALGRVTRPARIWLTPDPHPESPSSPVDAVIPVMDPAFLTRLAVGDQLRLRDTRGRWRELVLLHAHGASWLAACDRTAYVQPGTRLHLLRDPQLTSDVGALPPLTQRVEVREGDRLLLSAAVDIGQLEERDESGRLLQPAVVPCTLPEVFRFVRAGEPVWLDDGKIGGVVETVTGLQLTLRVTRTGGRGVRLGADKGINFPETQFELPGLTEQDRQDLRFVSQHADLVALSFLDAASDVEELQQALAELGASERGIVLKIETKRAFERLPSILLAAMRSPRVGVMIARGDLAVECGFVRLAEVQEEILWLSEAAHLPSIWATQVLEGLAQSGMPSRAEITDAAMAERAECVMLNKGPHMVEAIRVLDGILSRMTAHQQKKRAMLRPLRVAGTAAWVRR